MYTDFVNILVILSENCVSKDVRNKLESGLTYVQNGLEVVGGRVVDLRRLQEFGGYPKY